MFKMPVSKTQIDRLGDRLKGDSHTERDLRLLDDYRQSFGEAYEAVVQTIRQRGEFPTGRPAKSTASIAEKLRRESLRLSQMQDIAGCRIVVTDVVRQEQFVASLRTVFPGASVIDRRDNPSYGYRAIHIIAEISGKPVEIQVRTALQHLWAEVSEKSSDVLDPTIKYGGGPDEWRSFLTEISESVAAYENCEKSHSERLAASEKMAADCAEIKKLVAEHEHQLPDQKSQELRGRLEALTRKIANAEQKGRENLEALRRLRNDFCNLLTWAISLLDKRAKEQKQ